MYPETLDKYPHAKKYLERTNLSIDDALIAVDLELKKLEKKGETKK